MVNGTYAQLDDLPFYTEYEDNPALAALVKQMGGTANLTRNAADFGGSLRSVLRQFLAKVKLPNAANPISERWLSSQVEPNIT